MKYIITYIMIGISMIFLALSFERLLDITPTKVSMTIFAICAILLFILCLISLAFSLYWFLKPNAGYSFSKKHVNLWYYMHIGAFMGCSSSLYFCVFVLPLMIWEEGDNDSRGHIVVSIVFAITGILFYMFYKYGKMREEYQIMKITFEMEEEKKKIAYLSKSSLMKKVDEFNGRRQRLLGIILSPVQQHEEYCLDEIIQVLKNKIESLKS